MCLCPQVIGWPGPPCLRPNFCNCYTKCIFSTFYFVLGNNRLFEGRSGSLPVPWCFLQPLKTLLWVWCLRAYTLPTPRFELSLKRFKPSLPIRCVPYFSPSEDVTTSGHTGLMPFPPKPLPLPAWPRLAWIAMFLKAQGSKPVDHLRNCEPSVPP